MAAEAMFTEYPAVPAAFGPGELAERVAEHKGLRLRPRDNRSKTEEMAPSNVFFTKPFGIFEENTESQQRMQELFDIHSRLEVKVHPRKVPVSARLIIRAKGVLIRPDIKGIARCSNCGEPYSKKILATLADLHPESELLQEFAAKDFRIFVPWEEIGEAGLVFVPKLFREFVKGNQALVVLAASSLNPFNIPPDQEVFLPAGSRQTVWNDWTEELHNLIHNLEQ